MCRVHERCVPAIVFSMKMKSHDVQQTLHKECTTYCTCYAAYAVLRWAQVCRIAATTARGGRLCSSRMSVILYMLYDVNVANWRHYVASYMVYVQRCTQHCVLNGFVKWPFSSRDRRNRCVEKRGDARNHRCQRCSGACHWSSAVICVRMLRNVELYAIWEEDFAFLWNWRKL